MVQKYTDTRTGITANGTYNPQSLTKAPEGGFTSTFKLSAGSCRAKLRAWNDVSAPEIIGVIDLPVPSGVKAGDMFATIPCLNPFHDLDFVVESMTGGGTLTIYTVGLGI